jgi:hypothetical protein
MRILLLLAALLIAASPASAEDIRVVDRNVTMILDPAAPELTCTVVESSGNKVLDDFACNRAAAAHARHPGALPPGTYFYYDSERRPVQCRTETTDAWTEAADQACADLVQRMQSARLVRAIRPHMWLAQAAFTGFTGPEGMLTVRIGVGSNGRPSYCYLETRSGNRTFDGVFCTIIRKRARFEPALNSAGQPTPSVYRHRFRLSDAFSGD